jgi:hypothetical protein
MGFILIIIGILLVLRPRHHFGCGGPMFYHGHHHHFHDHCGPMGMGGHHGPMGGPGGMHGPMF